MEKLKPPRLGLGFYLLAALLLTGVAYQGMAVYQQFRLERALAEPGYIHVKDDTPPLMIFAKAQWLAQTANTSEAARLYGRLRNTPDVRLRARAFHNLATLYLHEAAQRWNARGVLDAARVGTLVELAKQNYRVALRLEPDNENARYNLEYAYRITPPPKERAKSDFKGTKPSVYSTMPGLPVGGP